MEDVSRNLLSAPGCSSLRPSAGTPGLPGLHTCPTHPSLGVVLLWRLGVCGRGGLRHEAPHSMKSMRSLRRAGDRR